MKQVNYTEAQTAQAVQMFKDGAAIEVIAEALGKTAKSIVAKLVREGVYKAKAQAKTETVRKADMAKVIADATGAEAEDLEKLNKMTLTLLVAKFQA